MTSFRSRLRITRNLPPSPQRPTGMKRAYTPLLVAVFGRCGLILAATDGLAS